MVPPHTRGGGGLEPAGRALELAGRASEQGSRALEPAGRALEPAGRPGASWEGQLRGGTEKTEQSITSMWWYHRSLSPTGPLPKKCS